MDRKFIFCIIVGFVCLYKPAKAGIIRNEVSDFESLVDESLADAFKKIKLLETMVPEITKSRTSNDFQVQILNIVSRRVQEFLTEIKSFYVNLKAESIKSGVLPDMDKNLFDLKLLELGPKYMDLLYTDVVAIIFNEPRLLENEKLTIINEMQSILEILKINLIPKIKEEISDHPQDWTGSGLLGTTFVFVPDETPVSESQMAALMRFYDIVHPYELPLRTHSDKLDIAFRKFFKRIKQETEDQVVETDEHNNQV